MILIKYDFRKKVRRMLPDLEEMRKPVDPQVVERLVLNFVTPGTRLRLRENVHKQLRERETLPLTEVSFRCRCISGFGILFDIF
jgi:hypothetical protein